MTAMAGTVRLQLIGAGSMGSALLLGLIARGWAAPEELHVSEPDPRRRAFLEAAAPGASVGYGPCGSVDAVIAVKPTVVGTVLPELAEACVPRVLSIAAGVRTGVIESALPPGTPVVRCMPNTPALIGKGAAAIAAGTAAAEADLRWAAGILEAVGTVEVVPEHDLDAVTALSGSGPAYVFRLAEALTAAGIAQGLEPSTADALTRQTLLGAAKLLAESGDDPAKLRRDVSSPGGTTLAALKVIDAADFMGLMRRAVRAAAERSRELGR